MPYCGRKEGEEMADMSGKSLPLDMDDPMVVLYLEAGKAWVEKNTSFVFDTLPEDWQSEGFMGLPGGVKAFLVKYCEEMAQGGGVQSESVAGMYQTFTHESQESRICAWAAALMPQYYKSAHFVPAEGRWS